jgi:hypothetical protein
LATRGLMQRVAAPHHEYVRNSASDNYHGIRRRGRGTERRAQHGEQRNHLDDALGQYVALSEVDADILCGGCRRRREEHPGYPDRHRHQTDTAVGSRRHDFPGGRPSKLAISSSRFS